MGTWERHALLRLGRGLGFLAAVFLLSLAALLFTIPFQRAPGAPSADALGRLEAYRRLGSAGTRCVDDRSFGYDPRRETADPAFVVEAPERAIAAYTPRQGGNIIQVERVEVFHQDPLAVVWARVRYADGREEVRPFTLRPTAQGISLDLPNRHTMLCYTNMRAWQVVTEALPYTPPSTP